MPDAPKKAQGAKHLQDADFHQVLDNSDKPVLVDFYADWCGPCQMAAPVIAKLAEEYKDKVLVAKLNVDGNNQTASEFGVMSIPTVIVFKKNEAGKMEEVDRKIGFPGEAGYRQMLDQVAKE